MKAAQMKTRPAFSLMKQTDVQSIYYMQMPRWLFSDPRYADLSLDAKVAYTFLLNRFQLSRRKGWVNEQGEVFIIFPRTALAQELLDGMILRDAEGKLTANLDAKIKNSTAYTMATIFNCITESDSDLMVDPYLNSLRVPAEGRC